ncbi:hypothetical protein [Flavivirga sp. 57AJ16]|uniref:hypothetical protein n=1 Tax=Flavivirga sp. 57AJ16 TaxID=3025307 RepID=UPI00236534F5|nr:hypothetical protein [Flavivirga sp. 57AJ16]MDD7886005.1 hypothetical protein [Flavivirga sp. 57AJ16]
MKKITLALLISILLISCSSNNYNEEFIGTWKKENSSNKLHFSEAENNQLRLKFEKFSGNSENMIMEFEDEFTVKSTMGETHASYYTYKLKTEDGKTYIVHYTTNDKYFKM